MLLLYISLDLYVGDLLNCYYILRKWEKCPFKNTNIMSNFVFRSKYRHDGAPLSMESRKTMVQKRCGRSVHLTTVHRAIAEKFVWKGEDQLTSHCMWQEWLSFQKVHISLLVTYNVTGFVSYDQKFGGYNAEEFMDDVERMINSTFATISFAKFSSHIRQL